LIKIRFVNNGKIRLYKKECYLKLFKGISNRNT